MVTTFSCEVIELEEIIRCAFELNKTQYTVFKFLIGEEKRELVATEISRELELDRTTVQKALTGLMERKIVERTQRNLEGGGYTFYYSIIEKEKLKDGMKKSLSDWCEDARDIINKW